MTVSLDELKQLGFAPSHKITLGVDGLPRFSAVPGGTPGTTPAVYLWLAQNTDAGAGEVLYVGKAGKGVARRCAQHQGGFTNSGTGRKNAAALAEILSANFVTVTVMARQAGTTELFGQTVSLYATEEDALCARFAPRLNRAVFPDVTEPAAAPADAAASAPALASSTVRSESDIDRIGAFINSHLRVQDEGTQDDLLGQIEAYSPQDLAKMLRMLDFLEARLLQPGHGLKLVGMYGSQIAGCNGVTTLGFGNLVNRNFSPNGWIARIFLTDTPRIAFPKRILEEAARNNVEHAANSFAPLDLDAFFQSPSDFILAEHLR